jgi:hypothetical protein
MRDTFNYVAIAVGMDFDIYDEGSGVNSFSVDCTDGYMYVATDFRQYFEVSYYNRRHKYLGGFMISDTQDEEMWTAEDIVENMVAFVEIPNER